MSMPARSWSPPLESHTRTTTSISVVRARPEHLKDIHRIQILAYPERTDFHEDEDVFRSKLETYPAGNFVAVATYSVVTNDDTSTWQHIEIGDKEGEEEEMEAEEEEDEEEASEPGNGQQQHQDDDITTSLHEVSVVEIIETAPDGTTTTTTTATSTETTGETPIIRARTPDITIDGDDSEDEIGLGRTQGRRSRRLRPTSPSANKGKERDADDDSDEDDMTTILVQWEQPIGYLLSHPYSRESMTLHSIGGYTDRNDQRVKGKEKEKEKGHPTMKKVRLDAKAEHGDSASESESEESEQDPYEHDQKMEKYYIHDCAVHPDWRGRGLASKLWKALEESLAPSRDDGTEHLRKEGDLVDTEEEEEEEEEEDVDEKEEEQKAATGQGKAEREQEQPHRHGHRRRRGGSRRKRHNRHVGAPNLKEIVLVSVQGTRPFWEHTGGFQVVPEHDHDLSVYGAEAFMMSAPFRYWR
ncbi:hypothetical protein BGZ51_002473 [Haplosporangium sp. Z 767]|nr:hypothetical protein BGZ51_002473 [Haplosporangium sp. Z 767]